MPQDRSCSGCCCFYMYVFCLLNVFNYDYARLNTSAITPVEWRCKQISNCFVCIIAFQEALVFDFFVILKRMLQYIQNIEENIFRDAISCSFIVNFFFIADSVTMFLSSAIKNRLFCKNFEKFVYFVSVFVICHFKF